MLKAWKGKEKDNRLVRPLEFIKLNAHVRSNFLRLIQSKIFESLAYPRDFRAYYTNPVIIENEIFVNPTINVMRAFFAKVFTVMPLAEVERLTLLKCLVDRNGVRMDKYYGENNTHLSNEFVIATDLACIELLASVFCTKVDVAEIADPIVIEHCKHNPTLGNILYLYAYKE